MYVTTDAVNHDHGTIDAGICPLCSGQPGDRYYSLWGDRQAVACEFDRRVELLRGLTARDS